MILKKYFNHSKGTIYSVFAVHLIISLILGSNARAENLSSEMAQRKTTEIEVDLSRFADDPWTVPSGFLMIESGYSFASNKDGGSRLYSHALPELLLRVGISQADELRLGWGGYTLADEIDGYVRGSNDMSVGSKHRLLEVDKGHQLDVSALFELGIPVGARRVSSRKLEPGAGLLWLKGIGSLFEISGNSNLSYLQGERKGYTNLSNSLALDLALGEQWSTYVEYFVSSPLDSVPETTEHYASTGITYLVSPKFELDLWLGAGLNSSADDLIAGVGFAYLANLNILR